MIRGLIGFQSWFIMGLAKITWQRTLTTGKESSWERIVTAFRHNMVFILIPGQLQFINVAKPDNQFHSVRGCKCNMRIPANGTNNVDRCCNGIHIVE